MVVDAMSLSRDCETIVLLSGDGDFAYLLRTLREEGKHTVVISLPIVTSSLLRSSATEYINLENFLAVTTSPREELSDTSESLPMITPQVESFYLEKGVYFPAYIKVRSLLKSANRSVTIIDGYINEEILYLLAVLSKGIKSRIITRRIIASDFDVMVSKLRKEGRGLEVYKSDTFHDRFIRIDDEWWHLGHSIKDLGSADALLSKVIEPSVIAMLRRREDEIAESVTAT